MVEPLLPTGITINHDAGSEEDLFDNEDILIMKCDFLDFLNNDISKTHNNKPKQTKHQPDDLPEPLTSGWYKFTLNKGG